MHACDEIVFLRTIFQAIYVGLYVRMTSIMKVVWISELAENMERKWRRTMLFWLLPIIRNCLWSKGSFGDRIDLEPSE